MKRMLLTTLAAICAAGSATAGSYFDTPAEPTTYDYTYAPKPESDGWTGFYVGVLGAPGGFRTGNVEINGSGILDPFSAATYGAFAGYNHQMDNYVVGVELDAQMGSGTQDTVAGLVPGASFDIDYLVDARLRLGYAFDKVLMYAAGGYTMGALTGPTLTTDKASGWNAGAGLELSVASDFFVGGEYVYRSLSSDGPNLFGFPFTAKSHSFQARAGYRF